MGAFSEDRSILLSRLHLESRRSFAGNPVSQPSRRSQIPSFLGPFREPRAIQDITCPSLVIHGKLDEVIPFRQGRKIHKELPEPKSFLEIPTASHNDLGLKGGQLYQSAIDDFFSQLVELIESLKVLSTKSTCVGLNKLDVSFMCVEDKAMLGLNRESKCFVFID